MISPKKFSSIINSAKCVALIPESFCCKSHLTNAERLALYSLAKNKKRIAEIGSYVGASACCFAAAHPRQDKRVYCIDTWANDNMSEGKKDTLKKFMANTKRYSNLIVPLQGWSTEVAPRLKTLTESIDLLFIDGDHSEEGVKADWDAYKGFLTEGSIVVFHDIGWAEGVRRVVDNEVARHTVNSNSLPNMWWGTLIKKP